MVEPSDFEPFVLVMGSLAALAIFAVTAGIAIAGDIALNWIDRRWL